MTNPKTKYEEAKKLSAMKGIVSGMKGYIYEQVASFVKKERRSIRYAKKLMDHPIIPWALAFPSSHVWQFSNQPRNFETNRRKLKKTTEKLKPTPMFFGSLKKVKCTPSSNPCVFFPIRDMFFSIFPNHKNPRPVSPRTWAPRPLHEGRGVKNHVGQPRKRDHPSQKGKDPLNQATWLSGATTIC